MTTEQKTGITVYDRAYEKAYGLEVAEEYKCAWNHDIKRAGVVNYKDDFIMTYPLNGWRARDLAEEVYGIRRAEIFQEVGKAVMIDINILLGLPNFDQLYVETLKDLRTVAQVVIVQVVKNDPGYGSHIIVLPA